MSVPLKTNLSEEQLRKYCEERQRRFPFRRRAEAASAGGPEGEDAQRRETKPRQEERPPKARSLEQALARWFEDETAAVELGVLREACALLLGV